tara:strand:+ start:1738 stop:1863 length:126 start_codon:yes stop_codon:yes gene_type:complete
MPNAEYPITFSVKSFFNLAKAVIPVVLILQDKISFDVQGIL